MATHMKTTIEIADDLANKAKELAARRGITLRAVIEEALRLELKEDRTHQGFKLRDASINGQGLRPEFQNQPWSTVRDRIYEGRGN